MYVLYVQAQSTAVSPRSNVPDQGSLREVRKKINKGVLSDIRVICARSSFCMEHYIPEPRFGSNRTRAAKQHVAQSTQFSFGSTSECIVEGEDLECSKNNHLGRVKLPSTCAGPSIVILGTFPLLSALLIRTSKMNGSLLDLLITSASLAIWHVMC